MVRKIRVKLVLQSRAEGLSGRAISSSQQMSRKSVTAVLETADTAGLGWDDVAGLGTVEVYGLVFPGTSKMVGHQPLGTCANRRSTVS